MEADSVAALDVPGFTALQIQPQAIEDCPTKDGRRDGKIPAAVADG
jgi:hypothetical protein